MKATTAARIAAALGATLVLVTGCAAGTPSAAAPPLVKVTYATWGFTALRPQAWRPYPYEFIGTLSGTIGYLSTDSLTDPCQRTPNSMSCEQMSVLTRLSSDGVLVRWDEIGGPLRNSITDFDGDPLTVGGSPARLEKPAAATGGCALDGGAVEIRGTVLRPDSGANFLQLDACIGPDAGTSAAADVEALFRSVEFAGG